MTWSEGHSRRDSERSKVGRGKVVAEGEEEEGEAEVEFAVVVVECAVGGSFVAAAVDDEFLNDDPIRASPPSAPGIDAHDDAALRAWRRTFSTELASCCSSSALGEPSRRRSTPMRRRRSMAWTLKRKYESVSPLSAFLPPLLLLLRHEEKNTNRSSISTPIVPALSETTCSCPRRLESRRSAVGRSPPRLLHCRESRRRVASPPLVRRRRHRRLRMSVPPRRLWPLAAPRSLSKKWPWSPLGAPKTQSTVSLFQLL